MRAAPSGSPDRDIPPRSRESGSWYAPDWERRRAARGPGILVWLAAGVLTAWVVAATGYVLFTEDRGAARVADDTYHLRAAYEGRISRLRAEVDTINGELAQKRMSHSEFDAELAALRRRQQQLEARQRELDALMDDAGHLAQEASGAEAGAGNQSNADPLSAGTLRLSFVPRGDQQAYTLASAAAASPASRSHALAALAHSQDRLEAAQNATLVKLESRALAASHAFETILAGLGIDLDTAGNAQAAAAPRASSPVGGPFVPVLLDAKDAGSAFEHRVTSVRKRLTLSAGLYEGLMTLPVRHPLDEPLEVTSGFGTRSDPFLGSMALHSGTDFRAAAGTPVHATADGIVESAGRNGGYGRVVDIRHDNGISTRYAHMSRILVKDGQTIHAGDVIGEVGSSGRSTGPHLHYETRINGEPVDAQRFITAGDKFFEQLLK